jgi:hypothetical protein
MLPRTFYQIDVQDLGSNSEHGDADGHYGTSCTTVDLMHGANVRLLIPLGQDKENVIAMLRKAADLFQRSKYGQPDDDDGIPF